MTRKRSFSQHCELWEVRKDAPSQDCLDSPVLRHSKRRRISKPSPMSAQDDNVSFPLPQVDYLVPNAGDNSKRVHANTHVAVHGTSLFEAHTQQNSRDSLSLSVNSEDDRSEVFATLHSMRQKATLQCEALVTNQSCNLDRWLCAKERTEVYEWIVNFTHDRVYRVSRPHDKHVERRISLSTAQLALSFLDRFFSRLEQPFPSQYVLLRMTIAAVRLACKYNETDELTPTALELIDYSTASIAVRDIDQCELILLEQLEWELGHLVPQHLCDAYYRALRVHGVASLVNARVWKHTKERTSHLLKFKYTQGVHFKQVNNAVFACSCMLLSRAISLRNMNPSNDTSRPLDMLCEASSDQVWPSSWSRMVGVDFDQVVQCARRVQEAWYQGDQQC